MSYILDALKKAEAERKLGDLPELYAPGYVSASGPAHYAMWRKALLWVGLMTGTAVAVAIALLRPWSATSMTATALPMPAKASSVVKAVPAPPPPPVKEVPRSRPSATDKKTVASVEKKPVLSFEKKTESTAASDATLPTLRDLSVDIQREIPTLSTNGYLYSSNRADRTVLLNQRLLHEGEHVSPDLVLEQLTPNGMVLNYKGTRFRTSY